MNASERKETVRYLRDLADLVAGGELELAGIFHEVPRTTVPEQYTASGEAIVHREQTVTVKLVRRTQLMRILMPRKQ